MEINQQIDSRKISIQYNAEEEVLPGVRYGRPDELLTPAYWDIRCKTTSTPEFDFVNRHGSLIEEIGFCLLGGYGVTLEVAEAFFQVLKARKIFDEKSDPSEELIMKLLCTPTRVAGRRHQYRFPRQRAYRLHKALKKLRSMQLQTNDPILFRNEIQSLEGVGPKTASWIARNWLGTDSVAILDIHILRAGWVMNLFSEECKLPRDYALLEKKFLTFAENIKVRASVLDAIIWSDMRKFGSRLVRDANMKVAQCFSSG